MKRSNETPTSIQDCIRFVDILLWLKVLGSRLDILTSVLIAMNYFIRCQKSTFNLEITYAYVNEIFLFTLSWIYLLYNYFLSSLYLKDICKTLKEIGKLQYLSELAMLLNLYISKFHGSLKNWSYHSFNTTLYMGKFTVV